MAVMGASLENFGIEQLPPLLKQGFTASLGGGKGRLARDVAERIV
jgi:hypothetical protein